MRIAPASREKLTRMTRDSLPGHSRALGKHTVLLAVSQDGGLNDSSNERITVEGWRHLWILRLLPSLCQLKFFWVQETKYSTQPQLNIKWELLAQMSSNCVEVEVRFGQGTDPVRNGSLSPPSFTRQLCSQVGSTRWLTASAGATCPSFTSKWGKRQASPNVFTRTISCANYLGLSYLN